MDVSKVQKLLDSYARAYWHACDQGSDMLWTDVASYLTRLHEALGNAKYERHEVLTSHKYKIIITVDRSVDFTSEYPKS